MNADFLMVCSCSRSTRNSDMLLTSESLNSEQLHVNSSTGYLRRKNSSWFESCHYNSLCRTRLLIVHCILWQILIFVSCPSKCIRSESMSVNASLCVAGKLAAVNGVLPSSEPSVIATISIHDPQSLQTRLRQTAEYRS
jgi:hypothetical protein